MRVGVRQERCTCQEVLADGAHPRPLSKWERRQQMMTCDPCHVVERRGG